MIKKGGQFFSFNSLKRRGFHKWNLVFYRYYHRY